MELNTMLSLDTSETELWICMIYYIYKTLKKLKGR